MPLAAEDRAQYEFAVVNESATPLEFSKGSWQVIA
jgi:hypothetical protein